MVSRMKIFISTDLHGSAFWAEKIVAQFEKSNADVLVLLGDVYNHGPRNPFPAEYAPMKVAEILSSVADRLVVVKGNCDSEVDQMISNFNFVSDYVVPLAGRRLFFTHGHVYNSDNLPRLVKGDALFYGHFHVNKVEKVNGVTCVCVGSCALPKDGKEWYCLADEKGFCFCDFDGKITLEEKF